MLDHYVEPHQVENVRNALPQDVRALWPRAMKTQSAA